MKTVKRLFTKCRVSGQSEFLALLDWRNTQNEGFGTRPAQRLMGRRCKTLVPEADTLLKPRYSTEEETRALTGSKQRQQHQYNHHAKPVYSRPLPSEKNRRRGVCGGSGRLYILRLASTDNPVLSLVLKRPITKFQCLVVKDYRTTVCRCLVHRRRYSARLVCLRFGSRCPSEFFFSQIRHRNALPETAWEEAVQGLRMAMSTVASEKKQRTVVYRQSVLKTVTSLHVVSPVFRVHDP